MGTRSLLRAAAISGGVALVLGGVGGERVSSRAMSTERRSVGEPVAAQSSCVDRNDCGWPLKGGLRIAFTGWACTTGFIARGVDDSKIYVVTAGHCISGSGLFARWSHHGLVIGRAALDTFGGQPSVDAGAIEIPATFASNELYATGQDDIRRVTGFVPDGAQALGTDVCRSGGTSGWSCGHVVRRAVATSIHGQPISHSWWTDFPSALGDSGSPVIDLEGRLVGIAVATTATQTVYVTAEDVMTALHVRPCLQAECR